MKKKINFIFLIFLAILYSADNSYILAQSPDELKQRREIILQKMEPGSVLVIKGNKGTGEFDDFKQDYNFYYLTGLNEPNGALIMVAPGGRFRGNTETLFMMEQTGNPDWEAQTLGLEGGKDKLGFGSVLPSEEFQKEFENILSGRLTLLYMDYERSSGLHSPLTVDEDLFKKAREKGSDFDIRSPSGLVNPLRRIKSKYEIETIQTAVNITGEAHKEAARSIKPGMFEFQLQAIIEHVFHINGAKRAGFNSIVGSGPNTCILHWSENSRKMQDGDLVVIDIGAEYNMYTADITRTIPVSGKFTERQKDIYNIVLAAVTAAAEKLKPGVSFNEATGTGMDTLADGLIKLGMIRDRSEVRKYCYHGIGHNIGLYVHDVGGMGILEPGMVFTIEPGLYIKEEGFGVRIEDNFLITETGYIRLSENIPRTVQEIEKLAEEESLGFERYLIKK
ncbi:aminopeptidase P N-terminal domain-containing protein [candidate division KSB1 bacterium]